jgi:hypothetical protein
MGFGEIFDLDYLKIEDILFRMKIKLKRSITLPDFKDKSRSYAYRAIENSKKSCYD